MITHSHPGIVSTDTRPGLRFRDAAVSAVILATLFFSAILRDIHLPEGAFATWRDSVLATFDVSNQFLWCGNLAIYIAVFAFWNLRTFRPRQFQLSSFWNPAPRDAVWIATLLACGFTVLVLVRYGLEYQKAAAGTDTLVLLCGVLLQQGLLWLATAGKAPTSNHLRRLMVNGFIFTGCWCLLLTPLNPRANFFYHGQLRWIAIYSTPNEFGLLMAVIFVLAAARAWNHARNRRFGLMAFFLFPAIISGLCVIKSYSREAWVSILAGFLFLLWNRARQKSSAAENPTQAAPINSRWARKALLWGAAGLLFGVCASYGIRRASQSNSTVVQRIFSPFNRADFSSRNRLASYQDGINMLLDRPVAGYGWDDVVVVHNSFYLQAGLSDGQALALNDFLRLALNLGTPALAIFSLFLWVWLSARPQGKRRPWSNDILLCRAATLMLVIGFNFSDSLCRLAPGGAFWLFLTLSMDFESVAPSADGSRIR